MKSIPPALLLFAYLLVAGSCNMEKRLYRNGWYTERTHHSSFSKDKEIPDTVVVKEISPAKENNPSVNDSTQPVKILPGKHAAIFSAVDKNPGRLREITGKSPGDSLGKMTYAQARASMARKGCTPDKSAMTVYYLSVASIMSLIAGIGFFLAIATLIYSIFAINKVVQEGTCVEENIAIIKAGKLLCWVTIGIYFAIALIVLVAATFLILFGIGGGW